MNMYCLGYTHKKCEDCQYSENWRTLNQLPDALRKPLQAKMVRVDVDQCRLTNMSGYQAAAQ